MSVRDELIEACARGDEITVRRLEWWPVKEALCEWWWSREPFTVRDLAVYARALGAYPAADVMAALPDAAGKWRPKPGHILAALRDRGRSDEKRPDVGRSADPSRSTAALVATQAALARGEQPCDCGAPSARKWIADAHGVWRCPDCQGVEAGQVFAAEDHTLTHPEQEATA